jgi:hypothetical protein
LTEETINVFNIFKEKLLGKRPTGNLEKDCFMGCVITEHATKCEHIRTSTNGPEVKTCRSTTQPTFAQSFCQLKN